MKWYLKVMKEHYSDFKGRARRSEYWMFTLFSWIFLFAGVFVGGFLGELLDSDDIAGGILGIIIIGWFIVHFIPSMAVQVRRLHDAGYSGWCLLIHFIPYIGGLIVFIFTVMDSVPGHNKWGPNPKNIGERTMPSSYKTKTESVTDEILKYAKMKEAGVLTEEEFTKMKQKLLNSDTNSSDRNSDINFE